MNLKTFYEKFELFADAPGAVAKMRELVLGLAYQGKPAEQHYDDPPVEELIQRIKKEQKTRKEGGKKAKPIEFLNNEEVPHQAPQHWSWIKLGGIGIIYNGNSVNAAQKEQKYFGKFNSMA